MDVARSFRIPGELRQIIDLCALYKLNALHLHLTDNEAPRPDLRNVGMTWPAAATPHQRDAARRPGFAHYWRQDVRSAASCDPLAADARRPQ